MEKSEGEVKHLVLVKFNEGLSEQQIEEYIKQFANLVNLIPSMKSFKWGKELGVGNMQQGLSHVFESSFESAQGVADYLVHPAHLNYASMMQPHLHTILAVDFNPTN